jgi:hypothetical protein
MALGGDESSIFDGYGGAFKPAAERAGLIAACPKGRDSASMYRGSAEQDVLDVVAEARRDYKINRINLMGHSRGYGTWSIAMAHPDGFAALGPIPGGGNPANMAKIARIPEFVVHGDNDPTIAVTQSRMMVEAEKRRREHRLRRSARRQSPECRRAQFRPRSGLLRQAAEEECLGVTALCRKSPAVPGAVRGPRSIITNCAPGMLSAMCFCQRGKILAIRLAPDHQCFHFVLGQS